MLEINQLTRPSEILTRSATATTRFNMAGMLLELVTDTIPIDDRLQRKLWQLLQHDLQRWRRSRWRWIHDWRKSEQPKWWSSMVSPYLFVCGHSANSSVQDIKNDSLRPVTIKQLIASDTQDHTNFTIDNSPISQVNEHVNFSLLVLIL